MRAWHPIRYFTFHELGEAELWEQSWLRDLGIRRHQLSKTEALEHCLDFLEDPDVTR